MVECGIYGDFSRAARVSADQETVGALMQRGVENVIPKELALKKFGSGEALRIYWGIDPTGAKNTLRARGAST